MEYSPLVGGFDSIPEAVGALGRVDAYEAEYLVARALARRATPLTFRGDAPEHFSRRFFELMTAIPPRLRSAAPRPILHPEQLMLILLGDAPSGADKVPFRSETRETRTLVMHDQYVLKMYLGCGVEGSDGTPPWLSPSLMKPLPLVGNSQKRLTPQRRTEDLSLSRAT